MKIKPGTQRAIAIVGEDSIGVAEHLQGWFDEGWRCVSLATVSDQFGCVVAVIEAGDAVRDEPDDGAPELDPVTDDEKAGDAENVNPEASDEGWYPIDRFGDLYMRRTPQHPPPSTSLLELRAGLAGDGGGLVRLRVGMTVTHTLLMQIEDVLMAAADEGD